MTALAWLIVIIEVLAFLGLGWCVHTAKEVPPDHPEFRDDGFVRRERLP